MHSYHIATIDLYNGRMKFALLTVQLLALTSCLALPDPTNSPISTASKSSYFGVSFTSGTYKAFEGSAAVLTCIFLEDHDPACVTSSPTGTIQKLPSLNSIGSTYNDQTANLRQWTLEITNVSRSDAGFYQCVVTCGQKMWTAVTKLRVYVHYSDVTTTWWYTQNGSLAVSCAASGYPRGMFEWLNSTGLTTESATKSNRLWHINSTMLITEPDPKTTDYYCVLTVSSGDFDIGVVHAKSETLDQPITRRSMGRRAAAEDDPDDQDDSKGFTVPFILILVLCCIFLGLLLKCLCNILPCLCCCRIPMM